MSDRDVTRGAAPPPAAPDEADHPLEVAAKKASRFSREFVATIISVVTTAFGVVVALAWNEALSRALGQLNSKRAEVTALFIYAAVITLLAVLIIIVLGRLATRIGAQPVEFKYPSNSKD